MNKKNIKKFKEKITGKVSFIKAMKSESVKKHFTGESLSDLKYFKVKECKMSSFQSIVYNRAYPKEEKIEEKGSEFKWNNIIQASLFAFPDKTWGEEGFKKYVIKKKNKFKITEDLIKK